MRITIEMEDRDTSVIETENAIVLADEGESINAGVLLTGASAITASGFVRTLVNVACEMLEEIPAARYLISQQDVTSILALGRRKARETKSDDLKTLNEELRDAIGALLEELRGCAGEAEEK